MHECRVPASSSFSHLSQVTFLFFPFHPSHTKVTCSLSLSPSLFLPCTPTCLPSTQLFTVASFLHLTLKFSHFTFHSRTVLFIQSVSFFTLAHLALSLSLFFPSSFSSFSTDIFYPEQVPLVQGNFFSFFFFSDF